MYEDERDRIQEVVGDWIIAIEHVGSTAVPGLGGKPTVDIMPAVQRLEDAERCIEPLASTPCLSISPQKVTLPP